MQKILYVRLPCNPIFPIGVVYIADHVHKLFADVEQKIFDLGTVPPLDFNQALMECIEDFDETMCTRIISFISFIYGIKK